jgi:hypothetical protein
LTIGLGKNIRAWIESEPAEIRSHDQTEFCAGREWDIA